MKVTREVISDLWPLFVSGEASADTRALIEEFLKDDEEYMKILKCSDTDQLVSAEIPPLSPNVEAKALSRTKRVLHGFNWALFFAIMFSCFSFGRIVSDTSWDVSPRNFIITAVIAACFWIAFFARYIWVLLAVYRKTMDP